MIRGRWSKDLLRKILKRMLKKTDAQGKILKKMLKRKLLKRDAQEAQEDTQRKMPKTQEEQPLRDNLEQ